MKKLVLKTGVSKVNNFKNKGTKIAFKPFIFKFFFKKIYFFMLKSIKNSLQIT